MKIKVEINELISTKIIELINQRADSLKRTINSINFWQVSKKKRKRKQTELTITIYHINKECLFF